MRTGTRARKTHLLFGSSSSHGLASAARVFSENCEIIAALLPGIAVYPTDTDILGRYSNTLLVSLNNRISIRNVAATRGIANRTQAITLGMPRFDSNTDIAIMEVERPSATYKSSGVGGV